MILAVSLILVAVLAWSAGTDRARLDRAVAERDESVRRRLAAEYALDDLRAVTRGAGGGDLGDHAWLLGALEDAIAGLLPGETAVAVTVQALAEGDGEPAVVLVAVTEDGVVLRSVLFPHDDDEECVFEDIDLPEPGSAEWHVTTEHAMTEDDVSRFAAWLEAGDGRLTQALGAEVQEQERDDEGGGDG